MTLFRDVNGDWKPSGEPTCSLVPQPPPWRRWQWDYAVNGYRRFTEMEELNVVNLVTPHVPVGAESGRRARP